MSIADLARKAANLAVNNSPGILTALGVVGTVTTAYFAAKASFVAAEVIRVKETRDEENGIVLGTPREVMGERVKLVWQFYIPAMTMGVATAVCIIGANRIGAHRAAGLAAGYTLIDRGFQQYKGKVIETIGANKELKIRDEIIKEQAEEAYHPGVEMYGMSVGEPCYDKFGNQFFRSTVELIRAAENDFNHELLQHGYGTLAEFYTALDIPAPPYSENIGWNSDRLMRVRLGAMVLDGKAFITMEFEKDPLPDYGRFR